ncbi:MAG: FUSC family protein [Reyranellaceae bacterium]
MQRLSLLAQDLLVFDRHRLAWRLAVRTLLALLVPLVAARLLGEPLLVVMALGGFLVSIGDSVEDGDRRQYPRLLVGTLAGALAVSSGALASTSLPLALLAAGAWCFGAALLGVWGTALAAMGLPIAWAVVEVGLPSGQAAPRQALLLGGAWLAGGVLVAVLTPLVAVGNGAAPLRAEVAACWRALADYLDSLRRPTDTTPVVPPETVLRARIAEARRLAGNRRSREGARERALLESVDRLFSRAALLRDHDAVPADDLARLADAARGLAAALESRTHRAPAPSPTIAAADAADGAVGDLTADLAQAWRRLDGTAPPDATPPLPAAPPPGLLAPLRAALDWQSVAARHALRFALVTMAAVGVMWVLPGPFGFWVPLTVTAVLKPYAGTTVGRTVQRVVGTMLGVSLGGALMPLLPGAALPFVAAAAFFALMLVVRFNYALAIFFLSLGLVPFEHLVNPALRVDVGQWRLGATAIGAGLALVGGHLLWPSFERRELPGLLRRCLRSAARYAAAALDGQDLAAARWQAGLDTTNLHTTAQRALTEIGLGAAERETILRAGAVLQRWMLAINAVANDGPAARSRAATTAAADALRAFAADDISATETAATLRRDDDPRLARLVVPFDDLQTCAEDVARLWPRGPT